LLYIKATFYLCFPCFASSYPSYPYTWDRDELQDLDMDSFCDCTFNTDFIVHLNAV